MVEPALLLQAGDDAGIRFYLEPLALLACRLGQPAMGARLLAGGDRMRRDLQYGCHPLNARAAALVRHDLATQLNQAERDAAEAAGSRFQGDDLRLVALAWLQQTGAVTGQRTPAGRRPVVGKYGRS